MTLKIVRELGNGDVLLVNKERVAYELIEWAQIKIAKRLGVSPDKVVTECRLSSQGKLQVKFTPDEEATKDIAPEAVQQAVTEEYQAVWLRVKERFEGLGERRGEDEEKEETSAGGDDQEKETDTPTAT